MEAIGFMKRLEEIHKSSKYIKILFQYPASDRVIVKRGYVQKIYPDSFDFLEDIDGLASYSYKFIVEIKEEREHERI